jgi:hypothetical protein
MCSTFSDISPINVLTHIEAESCFKSIDSEKVYAAEAPLFDGQYPIYRSRRITTEISEHPKYLNTRS